MSLGENQKRVLSQVQQHGPITSAKIAANLQLTAAYVRRLAMTLRKNRKIDYDFKTFSWTMPGRAPVDEGIGGVVGRDDGWG